MWFFFYFYFKRNYDVLKKSKIPCFLFNENLNFHKKEKESKMENPTQNFRGMNHVPQPV